MATRINRAKAAAANISVPIKVLVGHGTGIFGYSRVPQNTYIIFLAKPGHTLGQGTVFDNPYLFHEPYVRNAITRRIRQSNVRPVQLGRWTSHLYGPGDIFPEIEMELFDEENANLNTFFGITNLRSGRTSFRGHVVNSLRGLLLTSGPGIYIIATCRASEQRANISTAQQRNYGILPRMTSADPLLNRWVQMMENRQKRYAKFKRTRNNNTVSVRPLPPFAPGNLQFAPGRPTPSVKRPAIRQRSRRTPAR